MPEEVKVKFYDIEECGFYKRGDDEARFGEIEEALRRLSDWVDGKELGETEVSPPEDDTIDPTYCLQVHRDATATEFFVAMWIEIPTVENQVGSVNPNDEVNQVEVHANPLQDPQDIAGFPVYFWFLPEEDKLATVAVEKRRRNGRSEMERYMEDFLEFYAGYEAVTKGDTERHKRVIGHCQNHTDPDQEPENYYVRFNSSLTPVPGALEEIRRRRPEIRKVIRKFEVGEERGGVETLEDWKRPLYDVGLYSAPDRQEPKRVKYELDITPGEEELEGMIQRWRQRHQNGSSNWEDYAVVFKGENKEHSFSRSLPKASVTMDVERDENGFVRLESLQNQVLENRAELMERALYEEDVQVTE
ncbi:MULTISPECIES: hypothetical protein [Salinibacter]|uniref:hypothetical protein n=1 Tax=Salinibacter TaxID=146918 RepID=UPI0021E9A479|nr:MULTISPECIES: hypothetical protein [Salinibacter]